MLSAALLSITVAPALRDSCLRGRIRTEADTPSRARSAASTNRSCTSRSAIPRTTVLIGLFAVLSALPLVKKLEWEFMPPLDEGDLLYMPTTLPGHLDRRSAAAAANPGRGAARNFPRSKRVLGKVGRADSPTDPGAALDGRNGRAAEAREEWRTRFERRWYHGWTPAFVRPLLTETLAEFRRSRAKSSSTR